jgi:hypothetical protein
MRLSPYDYGDAQGRLYCEEACLGSVSEPRALVFAQRVGIGDDGCAAQRREDEETHD